MKGQTQARPKYQVTVTMDDGTPVFHGGADNLLLRKEGDHPTLCVVVAESLEKFAGPKLLDSTITPPTGVPSSAERKAFFADKHAHLVKEITEYENTHPDDAPCLDGAPIVVDDKRVNMRIVEKGLH